jgi:hypothetical protein
MEVIVTISPIASPVRDILVENESKNDEQQFCG